MDNLDIRSLKDLAELGKMKRENPKAYEEMMTDIEKVMNDLFKIGERVVNG